MTLIPLSSSTGLSNQQNHQQTNFKVKLHHRSNETNISIQYPIQQKQNAFFSVAHGTFSENLYPLHEQELICTICKNSSSQTKYKRVLNIWKSVQLLSQEEDAHTTTTAVLRPHVTLFRMTVIKKTTTTKAGEEPLQQCCLETQPVSHY